ncbi:DUF3168 domain-containing protein [Candidatus Phycosocius spiralis]|uniref:DUF3168 domain-containing protein n=1 Tax=Candidatus Phycosocius spiralis TaxID=2815099 RepID=A0ABQ4PX96_9PROT|nr:DUF3168 domain-containing protein [Candidatus Phycosocius spiralis]GIU67617.1 hypothetical protein PsB1_1771 [Candidatus Phycosocius spiralis]
MTAIACQKALEATFKADTAVKSALGNPARIFDAPVKLAAYPFAVWRRWETRSVDVSGVPTQEHIATLEVVCRQSGAEEARKAVAALAACATGPRPSASGARIVLVLPLYSDVMRAVDGRTWLGIVRLKIIAEAI